ncbi:hypothetical protein [Campylobacter sp. LR196d]|uniref:hypothetical protein n=1 Tax=Campylobacter sp. LR196d TaxID=2593543 RepID=UPI0016807F80|nr:hypothetical protein [Campylobacter sp. LR196d]
MIKIIFVNLHRMGFIERFTKKMKICEPDKRYRYRYVQISDSGMEFLQAKNELD